MKRLFAVLFLINLSFAVEGELIFKNSCMRCHTDKDKKPLGYLKEKYKGKPEAVAELARRCPWGQGLSEMEIELVSKWLAGVK
ncbi:MAG: c-type cytochrome [Aquificaceae bacterium]|jgi:mono/diheme cytochrome c family protein|uniref:c-type cytochrome n=1 Tax=Hydrogenobacter sp. Uz 6-8 TaxID=3384828 RepID=UPI000F26F954|nr:MAG: cytochrome c [Aquificota bacterium]